MCSTVTYEIYEKLSFMILKHSKRQLGSKLELIIKIHDIQYIYIYIQYI